MDLKDKLKYYQQSSQPKPETKTDSKLEILAKHLNANILTENSLPLIKRETLYTFEQIFNQIIDIETVKLPLLTQGQFPDIINLKNLLFFDLETTGLAGGAGTYPFLLGFAHFTESGFKVIQYFLPEYDRDVFAYIDFKNNLDDKNILVSFNGKSYDYPLLKTRFILNRFQNMFDSFTHLDLLHLSRRLWKNTLDSCSLQNIEREIFRFSRVGDIDGYLIPQAYFDFLQYGRTEEIKSIIFHNDQDLVSLARLLVHLSHIENDSDSISPADAEYFALVENAIRANSLRTAKKYLDLIKKREVDMPDKLLVDYSLLLKREAIWEEAIQIWQDLVQRGKYVLFSLEELAKYYEHQVSDYLKAKEYTDRALNYIRIVSELSDDPNIIQKKDEFEHRKARLEKLIQNFY